jgi:hypothetical protein
MAAGPHLSAATAGIARTWLNSVRASTFYTVCTLLGIPSGKSIGIVVLPALAVLGSKVVVLQAMNSETCFPFEDLKIHEQGKSRVVGVQLNSCP